MNDAPIPEPDRRRIIIAAFVLAIVGAGVAWYFILRQPSTPSLVSLDQANESISPSPSATPTPSASPVAVESAREEVAASAATGTTEWVLVALAGAVVFGSFGLWRSVNGR